MGRPARAPAPRHLRPAVEHRWHRRLILHDRPRSRASVSPGLPARVPPEGRRAHGADRLARLAMQRAWKACEIRFSCWRRSSIQDTRQPRTRSGESRNDRYSSCSGPASVGQAARARTHPRRSGPPSNAPPSESRTARQLTDFDRSRLPRPGAGGDHGPDATSPDAPHAACGLAAGDRPVAARSGRAAALLRAVSFGAVPTREKRDRARVEDRAAPSSTCLVKIPCGDGPVPGGSLSDVLGSVRPRSCAGDLSSGPPSDRAGWGRDSRAIAERMPAPNGSRSELSSEMHPTRECRYVRSRESG